MSSNRTILIAGSVVVGAMILWQLKRQQQVPYVPGVIKPPEIPSAAQQIMTNYDLVAHETYNKDDQPIVGPIFTVKAAGTIKQVRFQSSLVTNSSGSPVFKVILVKNGSGVAEAMPSSSGNTQAVAEHVFDVNTRVATGDRLQLQLHTLTNGHVIRYNADDSGYLMTWVSQSVA